MRPEASLGRSGKAGPCPEMRQGVLATLHVFSVPSQTVQISFLEQVKKALFTVGGLGVESLTRLHPKHLRL